MSANLSGSPSARHGSDANRRTAIVRVWAMRTAGLDDVAVAPWLAVLDQSERARAGRFLRAEKQAEFIAAHTLLRIALGRLASLRPGSLRFGTDVLGKPFLVTAPLSFNLSHTRGAVGVAAIEEGGRALGFDLEWLARKVDLRIADRFFSPREVGWLRARPPAEQPAGFLRLWTLKEAFMKATGKGLTQKLASFSINPDEPAIRFEAALGEEEWWFQQRILETGFVAAVGLRRAPDEIIETRWTIVDSKAIGAFLSTPEGCSAELFRSAELG